jgi:hypothetical protein
MNTKRIQMTNASTSIYGQGRHHQGGYATLGIAVVLLLVLSLMTIYLTRSGIIDIRTSANKARYAQALTDAERKLEIGLSWLSYGPNRVALLAKSPFADWVTCDTLTSLKVQDLGVEWLCRPTQIGEDFSNTTPPTTIDYVFATPVVDEDNLGKTFVVVAEGNSVDSSGVAVVKQGVFFFTGSGGADAPPLMGTGNIPLNGNFTVVPNPNSGGKGVPVSVWSKTDIANLSGSASTCQLGEYELAGGSCSGASVISSSSNGKGPDIVDDDLDFPDDVFKYIFGVPTPGYETVKAQATVVSNCNNLAGLTGTVWVTGDCTIPSGTTVGSAIAPLQLIVESNGVTGDFTMNANSTFYGLLFAFGRPTFPYVESAALNAGAIKANGGAKFYGAMISNDTTNMGLEINGTFDMVYSKSVMETLANSPSSAFKTMARIPSSWADFL